MAFPTVSLFGDARTAPARPRHQLPKRRRLVKLVAAFVLTVLVGASSYSLTYRALVMVSTSPSAHGSVVPVTPAGTTQTVPVTAAPAQSHP